jgi:hypothetical protein
VTPREHALRVAVLSALMDEVKAALVAARAQAQEVFAQARADGQTQQKVLLPDGTEIGLISIRGGSPAVELDEAGALLDWCEEYLPAGVESYIAEGAAEMNDVIALVGAHFPKLVRRRVRPGTRDALMKQMAETGGYVIDEDGGKHKLGTVRRGDPTGGFSYRPARGAQDRIVAEWMTGSLREIALGPLALPAAGGGSDET